MKYLHQQKVMHRDLKSKNGTDIPQPYRILIVVVYHGSVLLYVQCCLQLVGQ